jgi:hypothetical protein
MVKKIKKICNRVDEVSEWEIDNKLDYKNWGLQETV